MPPFDPALTSEEIRTAFPARYDDVRSVKSGAQGSVFRAVAGSDHVEAAGKVVALKVYSADHLEERTEREVAALKSIRADTLVGFVGAGRCDLRGVACVWLEVDFIEGESLAERILRAPLSVPDVAAIVRDISRAIDHVWSDRIVHRDIKPDNIMVTPSGNAVLIDLGIARHVDLSPLTSYGTTWGTPGYLSPEQVAARRALTCKSDVFALGVVAQEALLGRHPTQQRQDLLVNGGPSTRGLRDGVPLEFAAIIDSMLRKDAFGRPKPIEIAESMGSFVNQ